MKKILLVGILLLQMLVFAPKVNAASFSTSISGASSINQSAKFTVTVNVSTTTKIYSLLASLSYDKTKLKYIGASCLISGCSAEVGTRIVLDFPTSKSGSFAVINLTFQGLSAFTAGQSSTISISGVSASTGTADIDGTGSSRKITVSVPKSTNNNLSSLKVDGTSVSGFSQSDTSYDLGSTDNASISISATPADSKASVSGTGAKNLVYGLNSFNVVVTAENGSTKTYALSINRNDPRSSNNYLSGITLSSGELTFNKDTGEYIVTVENNVTSITIDAALEDAKSTLVGTGTYDLSVYDNLFELVVTAENTTTRTYKLNILRKDELGFSRELSKENHLSELSIEGLDIGFNPEIQDYFINVEKEVTSIKVNAVATDSKSTVEFLENIPLAFGQNVVSVNVTAENGEKRNYKLFVYRKNDAPYVGVDDILEQLATTESSMVILIPGISGIISKEILGEAAKQGIELQVEKKDDFGRVLYYWIFKGVSTQEQSKVDTNIRFTSVNEEKIHELSNYASGYVLNFAHEGPIPEGTSVRIYVGDRFTDGTTLKLYLFDAQKDKLGLDSEALEVKNGFVELEMSHASEYYLTQSEIKDMGIYSTFFVVAVAEAGVILALLILLVLRRKRKQANLTVL